MAQKEVTIADRNQVEWKVVPTSLHVVIVSPERTLFSGNVDSITVPGDKGRFEVLKNHAPIISSLGKGTIVCKSEQGPFSLEIASGFIEIAHNEVSVCVEI